MKPMVNFTLYETKTRFYIAASDITATTYRMAKIDKTSPQLSFTDDKMEYTEQQLQELLSMISHGNKSAGGLKKRLDFYGIFGFLTLFESQYMILITKYSPVALIGGHYINHIEDASLIPINANINPLPRLSRYLQIFSQVDRTKNFYFSYSFDCTRSLQSNMTQGNVKVEPKRMFQWNDYLTRGILDKDSPWFIPITYGFVDQAKISVYGHNVMVTLIARRSNCFAGARFLKRGVSDKGFVANDVETEQIVHDAATTLFSNSVDKNFNNPAYTSFLQHRGSIPLFWSQDISPMAAKPMIEMDLIDPFYTATARHFNDLFHRYGSPLIVLNLVKSKERVKRESILLDEFTNAINYLNQSLPKEHKIRYIAWDMARASKSDDQDVIGTLEKIAREAIEATGFFHSGREPFQNCIRKNDGKFPAEQDSKMRIQQGILRTNCIDCLDRTNAAQFVVGKCALGQQLYALGIIPSPTVPFDSDTINLFNAMYHDHGDTIALQYGGSHLVNTMETYRKMSAWTSHSRDMIESIKRYYSNSFTDAEKQDAMNVFLGYFVPEENGVDIWDLPSDYFLHNAKPTERKPAKSYVKWFDEEGLTNNELSRKMSFDVMRSMMKRDEEQYLLYYNPKSYTSIDKLFSYRMISTSSNYSSFEARVNPNAASSSLVIYNLNIGGVRRWLRPSISEPPKDTQSESRALAKVETTQPWNSGRMGERLLDPVVKPNEEREYERYIDQFKSVNVVSMLVPSPHLESNDQEQISNHPDFQFFIKNLNLVNGTNESMESFLNEENVYKNYVLTANTECYVGLGTRSLDIGRVEKYQHWLDTGNLPLKTMKKKEVY